MAEQKHDAAGNGNQQLWTFVVLGLLVGATLGFVVGSRGGSDASGGAVSLPTSSTPTGTQMVMATTSVGNSFPSYVEAVARCPPNTFLVDGGCGVVGNNIETFVSRPFDIPKNGKSDLIGWQCAANIKSRSDGFMSGGVEAFAYCK